MWSYCPLCDRRDYCETAVRCRDWSAVAKALEHDGIYADQADDGVYHTWRSPLCSQDDSYYDEDGPSLHPDIVYVDVDGGCSDNGRVSALSSYGIYFGPGNRYNRGVRFRDSQVATNQRAELKAAATAIQLALQLALHRKLGGGDARAEILVVRSDSAYVVNGIVDWIYKWMDNGWRNSRGLPVSNMDLWQTLHSAVIRLEQRAGVDVAFWKVDRDDNRHADALARQALAN